MASLDRYGQPKKNPRNWSNPTGANGRSREDVQSLVRAHHLRPGNVVRYADRKEFVIRSVNTVRYDLQGNGPLTSVDQTVVVHDDGSSRTIRADAHVKLLAKSSSTLPVAGESLEVHTEAVEQQEGGNSEQGK